MNAVAQACPGMFGHLGERPRVTLIALKHVRVVSVPARIVANYFFENGLDFSPTMLRAATIYSFFDQKLC
jgi:hypothetical protein